MIQVSFSKEMSILEFEFNWRWEDNIVPVSCAMLTVWIKHAAINRTVFLGNDSLLCKNSPFKMTEN